MLDDFHCLFTAPGDAPILNLAQSLSRAVGDIKPFDDADSAVLAFQKLQENRKEIVLIIDRFEELFTLNPPEMQSRFSEILSKLSLDANIRVVLSMRDDFLIACKEHDSLSPIFSEVTAIVPLSGAALRRALVQPALKCGYRFEDELMVDRILADVENERGALPLLAFATARLWEKRDRQNGLLTVHAYKDIGGVSGALAQYAESILEQMNSNQHSIVREIFRNLITAQNTRAARDIEELLSVFPDRHSAEEVLRILIDARLLTSFETQGSDGNGSRKRVEIIHESLLNAWPRLVRWLTQDADSALLRDQLRQAAHAWKLRNHSDDLLWSGAAFLEYKAWRQSYSGRLSPTEEAFVQAMTHRAGTKRRQRRIAIAATFVVLLSVLAIVILLWRNASLARDQAIVQSRRAEAGRILAVARSLPNLDASSKLAYALRSIEQADTYEARQFALQAMAEGPAYKAFQTIAFGIQFSPDGKRLAASMPGGGLNLFPSNGQQPNAPDSPAQLHVPWYPQFSPNGDLLLSTWRSDMSVIKIWSISKMKVIRTLKFEGMTICSVRGGRAFFVTDQSAAVNQNFFWHEAAIRVWNFGDEQPHLIGKIDLNGDYWKFFDIHPEGKSIGYAKGNGVYLNELGPSGIGESRLIGMHSNKTTLIRFNPNGSQIASSDEKGEIRIWLLESSYREPVRLIPGKGQPLFNFWFDPDGTSLMTSREGFLLRWDLTTPADAEPMSWRGTGNFATFDQTGSLAITDSTKIAFYNYKPPDSYVFHGKVPAQQSSQVRFMPDGKSFLIGFSDDGVSIHKMPGEQKLSTQELGTNSLWDGDFLDVDPSGRYVALPTVGNGLHLLTVKDAKDTALKTISPYQSYGPIAFSSDGKKIAAALKANASGIEIWDLSKNISRMLETKTDSDILKFSRDGKLFSGDTDGTLRYWNLLDDSTTVIHKGDSNSRITGLTISLDGRFVATSTQSNGNSELRIYNLRTGKSSVITSHDNRVSCVAFDAKATKIVTGDYDGIVRVGPITGETPILLFGHEGPIRDVAIHPNGKWILSSALNNPTARLWRMPEGKPLQTLSTREFQDFIRKMTNVRVVADKHSPGGYRIEFAPFPGWR